jgi:hypothetical protein
MIVFHDNFYTLPDLFQRGREVSRDFRFSHVDLRHRFDDNSSVTSSRDDDPFNA